MVSFANPASDECQAREVKLALNIFKEWRETTSDHEAVLKVST